MGFWGLGVRELVEGVGVWGLGFRGVPGKALQRILINTTPNYALRRSVHLPSCRPYCHYNKNANKAPVYLLMLPYCCLGSF